MNRLALAIIVLVAVSTPSQVGGATIDSKDVLVIDGDTVQIMRQRPDARLVGFNAPETYRAECKSERIQGERAKWRLRELVRSGSLEFDLVDCSCRPGTEGTRDCNYGRRCGILKANGTDVGLTLIAEGLAVPFICGSQGCPPTPRPWCKGAPFN